MGLARQKVLFVRSEVEGLTFLCAVGFLSYVDGDTALQNISEFLALMGSVRVCGTAGFQREEDGFHHIFLCI